MSNIIAKQMFWDMTVKNIVNEFRHVYDDDLFVARMSELGYDTGVCYELIDDIEAIEAL